MDLCAYRTMQHQGPSLILNICSGSDRDENFELEETI